VKKIHYLPTQERIHQEAAAWVLRMDGGRLDQQELADLRCWAAQSPAHLQALRDTAEVWDRMDVMAGLSELLPLTEPPAAATVKTARPSWLGVAAMVMLAVIALGWLGSGWFGNSLVLETAVGNIDTAKLQDGSAVTLNTATKLKADFSPQQRKIELYRGEAFFEVAHDDSKPFVVSAGRTQIEAIGTAFSVQKLGEHVEVTVTEGRVRVTRSSEYSDAAPVPVEVLYLQRGDIAEIQQAQRPRVKTVQPEQIAQALMWQQRMLVFNGEALAEVVAEFSRYTKAQIEIADAEAAAIRVGGYFRSDDLDGMLKSLVDNFGIQVEQPDTQHFVLSYSSH